jgi:hypothetical protein
MGVIRGRIYTDFDYHPNTAEVGGPWPYTECRVCGKWMDPHTGEHAKTVDLRALLDAEEARLVSLSQAQHAGEVTPKLMEPYSPDLHSLTTRNATHAIGCFEDSTARWSCVPMCPTRQAQDAGDKDE